MHPHPIENEAHTLALDLNRGMIAGMDSVDVNTHLDDSGIDRGTSQARMETPKERFQADRAQTESTQEIPPHIDSQKLMEMMVKEFFQREEVDRKWKKKEEPDSAWLAVGRKGSDKLNKSATENSTASPHF